MKFLPAALHSRKFQFFLGTCLAAGAFKLGGASDAILQAVFAAGGICIGGQWHHDARWGSASSATSGFKAPLSIPTVFSPPGMQAQQGVSHDAPSSRPPRT